MAAESAGETLFGHTVSDLQTGLTISSDAISGTLKYVSSGSLATTWGAGNFMALDFSGIDTTGLTSLKVGMYPSEGSGLVEAISDPDMNGVFKVTNKDTQVFRIVATDGTQTAVKDYKLTGLTLQGE